MGRVDMGPKIDPWTTLDYPTSREYPEMKYMHVFTTEAIKSSNKIIANYKLRPPTVYIQFSRRRPGL